MQFSCMFYVFQAEDGIRDLVRSRGLGDVYKRQVFHCAQVASVKTHDLGKKPGFIVAVFQLLQFDHLSLIHI